jgi:hypothetical protein
VKSGGVPHVDSRGPMKIGVERSFLIRIWMEAGASSSKPAH